MMTAGLLSKDFRGFSTKTRGIEELEKFVVEMKIV
jgi:hypothetical protein